MSQSSYLRQQENGRIGLKIHKYNLLLKLIYSIVVQMHDSHILNSFVKPEWVHAIAPFCDVVDCWWVMGDAPLAFRKGILMGSPECQHNTYEPIIEPEPK